MNEDKTPYVHDGSDVWETEPRTIIFGGKGCPQRVEMTKDIKGPVFFMGENDPGRKVCVEMMMGPLLRFAFDNGGVNSKEDILMFMNLDKNMENMTNPEKIDFLENKFIF